MSVQSFPLTLRLAQSALKFLPPRSPSSELTPTIRAGGFKAHSSRLIANRQLPASRLGRLLPLAHCESAFSALSRFSTSAKASPSSDKSLGIAELSRNSSTSDHKSGSKSPSFKDPLLFCGNANPQLATAVASRLGSQLGRVEVKRFADGEVSVLFKDSIRGKDIYIIQSTSAPVNENLMELLLMISTCRRSSARTITAVIPYYGYARQDRKLWSRVPISAADVAKMLEAMGVDRVIAVDLHSGQIQGFFGATVPVDNLEAQRIGLEYFAQQKLVNPVVVSPDAGGVYRTKTFQEGLMERGHKNTGLAMIIKQRSRPNEIERMDLVGNVKGSDVIIVDDMIDTAGTLTEAARALKAVGAKRVLAFATHGLFNGPAIDRIEKSPLEEVIVSDSATLPNKARTCSKVKCVTIAGLLADAIQCIQNNESMHLLFNAQNKKTSPTP